MAPPVDVAGLRPRLGDVPMWKLLRSRGRVRAPRVGRGGDCWLVPGQSPSPGVGRSGVRRLLGPSPSPSPGSGEAEIVVSWGQAQVRALGRAWRRSSSSGAEPKSEPWVGRGGDRCLLGLSPSPSPGPGGVRRLPGLSPSPSPGSGGTEFAVFRDLARVRALGRAEFAVFRDLARVRALGRAEFVVFQDLARVRALGSGEAELPMEPSAGPDCLSVSLCQVAPQSEWRTRRCPSVRPVSGAAK
jgi:hypothetical protein